MHKKWIVGISGAAMLTASVLGATAYAATNLAGQTSPAVQHHQSGQTATSQKTTPHVYNQYKTQIKAEHTKIMGLIGQLRSVNQQIRTTRQQYKGQHVWKNNPTVLQEVKATHQKILEVHKKIRADHQSLKGARKAKNWKQVSTDLGTIASDLQNLIGLKDQQLSYLKSVQV